MSIIDSSFITPNEFRQFIELQMQKRIGQLLTINAETFTDEVAITADQVQSYFDNNQDLFQTDEEVDVEVEEEEEIGGGDKNIVNPLSEMLFIIRSNKRRADQNFGEDNNW